MDLRLVATELQLKVPQRLKQHLLLREILGLGTRGPRVVVFGEGGAEPDWRVRTRPELNKGRRIRIDERVVPQQLEGGLPGGLRIGNDAVDDLFAVDVGGVFVDAAIAVVDRLTKEADDAQYQDEN